MKNYIIVFVIVLFTSFTLTERNHSACGELCEDEGTRLYHDIDKNVVKKKKKRKKNQLVI